MAIYINGKKVAGVGMPGKDGKSAYQLAVEGGYQGTEEEFSQILANGGLPSGGTPGQMLYQGESGPEWGDKPDAQQIDFTTGATGLTAKNVQDAIEEVNEKIPTDYLTPLIYFGDSITFLDENAEDSVTIMASPEGREHTISFSPDMSVTLAGLAEPTDNYDAANKKYVDSKAPKYRTVTLTAAGWSSNTQTVTVSGVLADESAQLIQPMPAIASQNAYITAGIICSGQAANQLTFKCSTVPTNDISLYVVITEVRA